MTAGERAAGETGPEEGPAQGPTQAPGGSVQGAGESGQARDAALAELYRLRGSIDNIDAAVIHMLAERFKCTQRVGRLKADHGLPPADPAREKEQVARLRRLAEESHLDPAFAEKFLTFVIDEVIHHHQAIAAEQRG